MNFIGAAVVVLRGGEYYNFENVPLRTYDSCSRNATLDASPTSSVVVAQRVAADDHRSCMVHSAQPLSPRRKYLTPSEIVQRKTTLAQLRGPDLKRGTMLAVVYTAVGPPSVLHVMTNFPKPIRAAGEVLVKVCLAGT